MEYVNRYFGYEEDTAYTCNILQLSIFDKKNWDRWEYFVLAKGAIYRDCVNEVGELFLT